MTKPAGFKFAYFYAVLLTAFSALMVGMSIFSLDVLPLNPSKPKNTSSI